MMTNRRNPSSRTPKLPIKFIGGQTMATTCNCNSLQDMCAVWNVNYEEAVSSRSKEVLPDDETTTTTTTTTIVSSAMADNRRYDDSYFMKHEERNESTALQLKVKEKEKETKNVVGMDAEEKKNDDVNIEGTIKEPESKRIKT
jgi:hypothetical protein